MRRIVKRRRIQFCATRIIYAKRENPGLKKRAARLAFNGSTKLPGKERNTN
jgi:hypothetical protein